MCRTSLSETNKTSNRSCLDIQRHLIDTCSQLELCSYWRCHAVRAKPMISIAAATGLLEAIEAAGGSPDGILQIAGLDRSAFSKPEGFIPCSVFAEILRRAAQATGDDCFGLHFGERFDPKHVGPLVYVALNSPTIGAGIQNVERYLHVYDSSAKWFFTAEG